MAENTSQPETPAPLVLDVGAQQLGKIYAKAFLGAAEAAGKTEELLGELDSLVSEVWRKFPDLAKLLSSALVSEEDKSGIIDRVLGGRASPLLLNFLKVLSKHGRLDVIPAIHRAAHDLYDQMRNRIRVRLTTAGPLENGLQARITEQLRGMLGGEPMLQVATDPELIGGVVLHVGDTVYDGSVATRLKRVREQMINRSVHEIQSRRDRFSNPEGN